MAIFIMFFFFHLAFDRILLAKGATYNHRSKSWWSMVWSGTQSGFTHTAKRYIALINYTLFLRTSKTKLRPKSAEI